MRDEKTQAGIFSKCSNEGSYIHLAKSDAEIIESICHIAEADFKSIQELTKLNLPKGWNAIYKLSYDVLHMFAEAFMIFDKIKARTHECLFTYICEKHPELEISWDFFEKLRTKRNQSQYY